MTYTAPTAAGPDCALGRRPLAWLPQVARQAQARHIPMATSSLTGGEHPPRQPSGTDVASLGPSDLSDSGSDMMGALDPDTLESDSDSLGTGERASVDPRSPPSGADILPDHLEDALEAEDQQAELDFDADEVAEQAEAAASREVGEDEPLRDDPLLDDTPADAGKLAQEEELEPDADEAG